MIETLRQQLAASQAREVRLREALVYVYGCYPPPYSKDKKATTARNALSQPTDTSALEAMIAKAGEVMRERCSDSAQAEMNEQYIDSPPWYAARACREAIRDIPCVTLEDLGK